MKKLQPLWLAVVAAASVGIAQGDEAGPFPMSGDIVIIAEQDTPLGHRTIGQDAAGIYYVNGWRLDPSEKENWNWQQWCLATSNKKRRAILSGPDGSNERAVVDLIISQNLSAGSCEEVKEAVEKSDLLDVSGELVDAVMPLGTFKVSGIGLAQSYINPDDLKYLWKNEKLTYLNVTDNKPPIYDCRIPKELRERIFCVVDNERYR